MRIPKFRAWDKKLKVMLNIGLADFVEKTIYTASSKNDEFKRSYSTIDHNETDDWGKWEDIEIIQSTGLFDKNGIEIFEGDIVKIPVENKDYFMKLQVEYCNGSYLAVGKVLWGDLAKYVDKCEVIGNIFENPELLESEV